MLKALLSFIHRKDIRKTFIILGPEGQDGVPMHWNKHLGEWVESGEPCVSTLYSWKEVFSFPPSELPVGVECILNTVSGITHTPLPYGDGVQENENNI